VRYREIGERDAARRQPPREVVHVASLRLDDVRAAVEEEQC
jgi:hypothetical protein